MTKYYLVHKTTGKSFEILRLDREAGMVTLKGARAVFAEPYDPDALKKRGYVIEKETQDAQQP